MCDCKHVSAMPTHALLSASTADLASMSSIPPSLLAARAAKVLAGMLLRGFTTVRDCGGADWGLAQAVEDGSFIGEHWDAMHMWLGPRILYCGHALSQTGGHGDFRSRGDAREPYCCGAGAATNTTIGRVCDGVDEVRKAARDELRKGAHHIKVMASGGVASPTDRLENVQFAEDELRALVEVAESSGAYVSAHAYTPAAISRAVRCGARSIEHGNMLDEATADLMRNRGVFLVPTLVTYDRKHGRLAKEGAACGLPLPLVAKVGNLLETGLAALKLAHQAGVRICYGSDLLGDMHKHQLHEMLLRSYVQNSPSIISALTTNCAALFGLEGELGVVREGALADLLVVDKNPLSNITVLTDPSNLRLIMKAGVTFRNTLPPA
eukprot:jgi/Chlat1/7358/Chrsp59S06960